MTGPQTHHATFLNLKEAIIQAPILHYPDPNKKYIVYTDASDDACGVQLSQEHDGMEFPVAFLLYIFTETQRKWSRWSLELATYNITFKWISGTRNKAADCLSQLAELPTTRPATVNMLTVTHTDGPASNTRSCTKKDSLDTTSTPHPNVSHLTFLQTQLNTPNLLTADRLEALLQMQRTDPFCRCISKHLFNGKALQYETCFSHVKGLLYKHVMGSGKQFLALIIPKSRKYMVLVEAHDKVGHQGNSCTYCLIKRQYYLKGNNKDIRKYIANCILCQREKAKAQHYPLQVMEILDRPFNKIAIDLIRECDMSTSGNKHILTIIDHLTGWPEAFFISDKTADTNSFHIYK